MPNDVEYILRIILRARDELTAVFAKARAEMAALSGESKKLDANLNSLNNRITSTNRRIGNVTDKFKEWRAELRNFAGDGEDNDRVLQRLGTHLDKLDGGYRRASTGSTTFNRSTSQTSRVLSSAARDTDRLGRSNDNLGRSYNRNRTSLAAFDNELRGLGLVLALGFAQQLTTALVGLGGQLVAVASSAAMAGAALGGLAAAGIAQGLPVLGLFIGAMTRVKATIDAVNQATKVQQAQSQARFQAGRKEADGADAIANAQDTLRNALQGVGDAHDRLTQAQRQAALAQENLTKARADAKRQLVDMTLAERDAKLAAEGATLSQAEAQQALIRAIATGQGVERAQLGVAEAGAGAQRARIESRRATADLGRARAGGVEGMEGVQQAKRAADDAARAVDQARQNIADAERAVTRATRGLEAARRNANEAVSGTQTAAANLNWLLSQLSPAERKLYEAIRRIQHTWKTAWTGPGGVTEGIINAFTYVVDRVNTIMKMPSVLRSAKGLADEMGHQIRRIFDSFTTPGRLGQMKDIAADAKSNLEPVADIASRIGRAFLNIAQAAGPAFKTFLGYVKDLAGRFLDLTGDQPKLTRFFNTAEKHLESWLNLAIAVGQLFAAITGAGGAEAGKKGIDDLTKSVQGMTDWIDSHKDKVQKFFTDARKVTDDVIDVVLALGREIAKTFSPSHTHNFARLLTTIVIPALGELIGVMGEITNVITSFLDIPVVGDIAKWGLVFVAMTHTTGSLMGGFSKLGGEVKNTVKYIGEVPGKFQSAAGKIETFGGKLTDIGKQFDIPRTEASKTGQIIGSSFTRAGGLVTRASVVMRAASAFAFGPWGLAIMAVIAAIILLDRKFHFLGPTFRWLKGAAQDVLDWLKTHWPLVLTILTGPFGLAVTIIAKNWGKIKGAVSDAFGFIRHLVSGFGSWVADKLGDIGRKVIGILPSPFRRAGKSAADGLINGIKSIGDFFAHIGSWLFNHIIKPIYDYFEIKSPSALFKRIGTNLANAFIDGLKTLPGKILGIFKGGAELVGKIVGSIMKFINDNTPFGDKLFSVLGHDVKLPKLPEKFAAGGPVPGYGGGDRIPALLEAGEHVWTKDEVARAGGHAAMFAMRMFFGGGGQSRGVGMANGGAPNGAGALTISFQGGNLDDFTSSWRDFWRTLVVTADAGADRIGMRFRKMRVDTTATADRMYRDVRGSLADIQNSFDVRGRRISNNWADTWQAVAKFAYVALQYVGHEANLSLDAFGASKLNFHLRSPDIRNAATGGVIGNWGERGRDAVPTWLGRGEAVLNFAHQRYVEPALHAFYGHGLGEMFGRVRGFHAGAKDDAIGFAGGGLTGPQGSGAAFTAIANFAKRKFGLTMTAGRTDHGYLTSTGNVSDHSWGGAGDFSDGFNTPHENAFNNFWLTKAPQVIKQLIWQGKDQQRGFPIDDHYDHVHLAVLRSLAFDLPRMAKIISRASRGLDINSLMAGVTDSDGTSVADHVDKIKVLGAPWARRLFQKLLDKVTGAANSKIDKEFAAHVPSGAGGPSSIPLSSGGTAKQVYQYFVDRGLGAVIAAGITGTFQKESGFSTSVFNKKGSGAFGLAQWLGGRLAALKAFGGDNYTSLQKQLDFVWHELTTSESGALSGVKRAKTPEEAATLFDRLYERSDGLLSAPAYARAIFNAFDQHAAGGIVGGNDGTPRPIIAHAGEWILNKVQQARLAGLTGLHPMALKSLLGFHGGGGSFQGGGDPGDDLYKALTTGQVKKIEDVSLHKLVVAVRKFGRNIDDMATRFGTTTSWFGAIGKTIDNLGDIGKKLDSHYRKLDKDDKTKGSKAFIDATDKLLGENGLFAKARAAIERRAGAAQQALIRRRLIPVATAAGRIVRQREGYTAEGGAQDALDTQNRLHDDLLQEQAGIAAALKAARTRLSHTRDPKMRQKLQGQINDMQGQLDQARERVGQSLQDILEAQIAVQQAVVDRITKQHERTGQQLDFSRRLASIFGNQGWMAQINAATRDNLSQEANELEARIGEARRMGATDLADQLELQVQDLRTQIQESLAQELQDAAQQIQDTAQRRAGRLDLFGRLLAATGVVGRTGAVALGGESLSATGIAQQQMANTSRQLTETQALLARVQAEQPENVKLIEDLNNSILDLTVTYAEQSRAEFMARVEDVNSRSDYNLSINDLNKQILELGGQISGNTDQAGLLKLATDRQTILQGKGNELQQLYNEAVARNDQQAIQDLTKAMLENQVAMLQNTQAINELTGASKDPQTFSSSAWTQFREAIFTGMGQILPQYTFPMAQTGGIARRAGLYQLHPGELIKPAGTWNWDQSRQDGDINIEINEAGRPIDTTEIAAAVSFARKGYQ